jgi:hypothetical protein
MTTLLFDESRKSALLKQEVISLLNEKSDISTSCRLFCQGSDFQDVQLNSNDIFERRRIATRKSNSLYGSSGLSKLRTRNSLFRFSNYVACWILTVSGSAAFWDIC